MTTASRSDILRLRLASQLLAPTTTRPIAEVARHFLAMQAQDFGQALWALGSRVPGSTRADVLAALDRGEIVRSWPMRGTLHWVAPEDLGWMLRLTTPRIVASSAARHRELELDQTTFDRARDTAIDALAGGNRLSRAAFLARLDAVGIRTTGQRAPHLIGYLAQTGVIVQGPPDGSQQAIVLLDEWVPHPRRYDEDESLREFVVRYVEAHGPATLRDFVWWSKVTMAQARTGFELARADLVELQHEGTSYWVSPRAAGCRIRASPVDPACPSGVRRVRARLPEPLSFARARIRGPDRAGRERRVPSSHRLGRTRRRHVASGDREEPGDAHAAGVRDAHGTGGGGFRPGGCTVRLVRGIAGRAGVSSSILPS